MEITQKIKDKVKELAKANPNLTSVGIGQKVSGGEVTENFAIVCGVLQKKPIEELLPEEVLPSEVTIDNEIIKLDVIEQSQPKLFATCSACGGWNGGASTNRQYTRPLRPGVTMSSLNTPGTVGTLGTFVRDVASGAILGLTNNHVTIEDASYTSQRSTTGSSPIENDYSPTNYVYQGSEGGMEVVSNQVGQSVRYSPTFLQSSGIANQIDAALFSVQLGDIDTKTSWQPIGLETIITSNPPFASTNELGTLFTTNPDIFSSGRTSGARGNGVCGHLRVYQTDVVINVGMRIQGVNQLVQFNNCISVIRPDDSTPTSQQPGCLNPGLQGDSGSAVYANIGGTIKLVGLLFAGSCNMGMMPPEYSGNTCCSGTVGVNACSTIFYFCRIDEIASQLGVEWWDPSGTLTFVNPNTIEYVTEAGTSSEKTKTCNGKTYWQAGLTDTLNNPC